MMLRWMEGMAGRIWYAAMLCAACLLAMAVGYAVVRGMASDPRAFSSVEEASMESVRHFRLYADELTRLTAAYNDKLQQEHDTGRGAFNAWVSREFLPGVNQLKRSLLADTTPDSPVAVLLRAADAAVAMASSPSSEPLRQKATDLVFDAREAVETYITEMGLPTSLAAP